MHTLRKKILLWSAPLLLVLTSPFPATASNAVAEPWADPADIISHSLESNEGAPVAASDAPAVIAGLTQTPYGQKVMNFVKNWDSHYYVDLSNPNAFQAHCEDQACRYGLGLTSWVLPIRDGRQSPDKKVGSLHVAMKRVLPGSETGFSAGDYRFDDNGNLIVSYRGPMEVRSDFFDAPRPEDSGDAYGKDGHVILGLVRLDEEKHDQGHHIPRDH